MDRERLEWTLRHLWPSATNAQIDHALAAADKYRAWRRPPGDAVPAAADPDAARHRTELDADLAAAAKRSTP